MIDNLPLPELLAPAGSNESLRAALAGGADAVYFGHSAFSNRMRAKNFTDDTIRDAIKLCHDCGAAAHITVNTRVRDREMPDVMRLIELLYSGSPDSRPDALIVADLGIARQIKQAFPEAVLHASTQTSLSSPADCLALSELGFSRLVVPRELSSREITALVKASPIEIETFVHGAHCVSLSGQCLMSFVQGGRSGNRGECAQPCRLPFSTDGDTTQKDRLSLSDMCLAGNIPQVISSGIASLKIEGRLKSPTYVYGVTSIYRRLLDERRAATPAEIADLRSLFYRGFTDGYWSGRYGEMSSVRVSGTGENAADKSLGETVSKKLKERMAEKQARASSDTVSLTAEFVLRAGEKARLTLICGDVCGTAYGEIPQASDTRPITPDSAAKNLTKFGGTGYSLSAGDIRFDLSDGLWMPLSAINSLRRDALSTLEENLASRTPEKKDNEQNIPLLNKSSIARQYTHRTRTELTAEIADFSIFAGADEEMRSFADRFDRIYVHPASVKDASAHFGDKVCAVLPPITPNDGKLRDTLTELQKSGVRRVLCHTLGQIRLAQETGLTADASFRANVTCTAACHVYLDLGCESVTLSPELPAGALKNMCKDSGASIGCIAYGRIPVMTTARCLICGGKCKKGNAGGRAASPKPHSCLTHLSDRMGESFPVIGQPDCSNVVYNSTPIWMGDRLNEIERPAKNGHFHFMFTTESVSEALDIAEKYSRGQRGEGRRI